MKQGFLVRVDLVVDLGNVALVGAEYARKGAELDPTQEELSGAMVLEQGIVYGRVASDIRMLEAVSREPAGEQPRNGALDAVVLVPINLMVLYVHTTCGVPLRRCAGRGAEDRDSADLGCTRAYRYIGT